MKVQCEEEIQRYSYEGVRMDDGNRAEIMSKVKGIMKMEEDFNIKITRGTGDYKFLEWIKNKQ